jgi:hypothetical protein
MKQTFGIKILAAGSFVRNTGQIGAGEERIQRRFLRQGSANPVLDRLRHEFRHALAFPRRLDPHAGVEIVRQGDGDVLHAVS